MDISAVGGKPVDFTAAPNPHFVNNGNDCPVIVTKLVINPAAAAAVAAAPQSKGWDFLNAMGEQMRAYEAQEAKKKADQEAAARAKAEREENLRQQMARKQQESLLAQEKEKQRKVVEAKQRAAAGKSQTRAVCRHNRPHQSKDNRRKGGRTGWCYKLRGQPARSARCSSDTQGQPDSGFNGWRSRSDV